MNDTGADAEMANANIEAPPTEVSSPGGEVIEKKEAQPRSPDATAGDMVTTPRAARGQVEKIATTGRGVFFAADRFSGKPGTAASRVTKTADFINNIYEKDPDGALALRANEEGVTFYNAESKKSVQNGLVRFMLEADAAAEMARAVRH